MEQNYGVSEKNENGKRCASAIKFFFTFPKGYCCHYFTASLFIKNTFIYVHADFFFYYLLVAAPSVCWKLIGQDICDVIHVSKSQKQSKGLIIIVSYRSEAQYTLVNMSRDVSTDGLCH